MDKAEASAEIARLLDEAMSNIRKAEELCKEHSTEEESFDFSFSPAYGMGGWFGYSEYGDDWGEGKNEFRWMPSSQSC